MAEELSPFVFWGQKLDHISLKIDLKDVSVSLKQTKVLIDTYELTT